MNSVNICFRRFFAYRNLHTRTHLHVGCPSCFTRLARFARRYVDTKLIPNQIKMNQTSNQNLSKNLPKITCNQITINQILISRAFSKRPSSISRTGLQTTSTTEPNSAHMSAQSPSVRPHVRVQKTSPNRSRCTTDLPSELSGEAEK